MRAVCTMPTGGGMEGLMGHPGCGMLSRDGVGRAGCAEACWEARTGNITIMQRVLKQSRRGQTTSTSVALSSKRTTWSSRPSRKSLRTSSLS